MHEGEKRDSSHEERSDGVDHGCSERKLVSGDATKTDRRVVVHTRARLALVLGVCGMQVF